jgi:asparagine synthase (glutamine-hydrolysing)
VCGIAGEISQSGPADVGAVTRMANAMQPRGPDAQGVFVHRHLAFGSTRLRVMDQSERADQPMVDTDLGIAVVLNGCIYNFRALRTELTRRGYCFQTECDTEVVGRAYHCWGEEFAERLEGMFAVAIADLRCDDVVLARDPLGIKPLYIADTNNATRIASTLPALLAGGGIRSDIDPVSLHHYLSFHSVVPGERTMLKQIARVPPGTTLRLRADGSRQLSRYWRLPENVHNSDRSAAELSCELLAHLRRTVRDQWAADAPVGVFLSGGLDSSVITALAAETVTGPVPTFSIGFESAGHIAGDEFDYSDQVSQLFETDHHQYVLSTAEVIDAVPQAVAAMSEPMASHDAVAFYILARRAKQWVTVVQTGQGADELFAGYSFYREFDAGRGDGAKRLSRLRDRDHEEICRVVAPDHRCARDVSAEFLASYFRETSTGDVDTVMRFDTEIVLVEDPLKRIDNMTMAWGLEARVPFLDRGVVEFAATCPSAVKLSRGGKGVLKDAATAVLPRALIDRPKGSFPVPALMNDGPAVVAFAGDVLRSVPCRDRGVFSLEYVDGLLASPTLTPQGDSKLWEMTALELWFQQHGL